ncbi:hypothetical protein ABIE45_001083 [Methylobacterium sp. OAE515]|jgi:hypothetical protein|uniref:hypothetical protein n=1 Tax=Methylobacterium sp. OAE515 TaxID=2817895 RepID=UPI00178B22DE
MLDVIARLLLSAGILTGTTYLPMLSQAVTAQPADAPASAMVSRACPAKAAAPGARALACIG